VTTVDKDVVVPALAETWESILSLGAGLREDEWALPTACPGWSVKDQLSHMIGTESIITGRPTPAVDLDRFDYLRNDIGRTNEAWIDERRSRPGAEVLEEFRTITALRLGVLGSMDQAAFDHPSPTPAGPDTVGRFMQIRVMDCWVHEQDMREATGRPGHQEGPAVAVALDEVVTALGFVVGKKAGAPDGSSVRFDLTGGSGRVVDVVVDGRARLSEEPVAHPTATITAPVVLFSRIAGGRASPAAHLADGSVTVTGDADLGRRVVDVLPYMI
jgi:uncharacterized protein (TIGR03083 family)